MASSNRHWPSLFKSKPCNNQLDNNNNLKSKSCVRSSGCEERTPEPKPRWNPKPEQIRILEAIFNSGLVNPPRDEIRRIRIQLQEYGNVGDANVFYWFQNRKSRSKHKQKALHSKTTTVSASSSSSSSPDNNNNNNKNNNRINNINYNNNNNYGVSSGEQFNYSGNCPNSINNNYYFGQNIIPSYNYQNNNDININTNINNNELIPQEHVFYPILQNSIIGNNNSFSNCIDNNNNNYHDLIMNGGDPINLIPRCDPTVDILNTNDEVVDKVEFQHALQELNSIVSSTPNPTIVTSISSADSTPTSTTISSNIDHILGVGEPVELTVFINGMAIGVPNMAINVKEEFGEGVMLVHSSSGHPVVTDESGLTLYPLQHGASYHLLDFSHVVSPSIGSYDRV